jgi:hypothetical protein
MFSQTEDLTHIGAPKAQSSGHPDILYIADIMDINQGLPRPVEVAACEIERDGTAKFILYGRVGAVPPPRQTTLFIVRPARDAVEPLSWSVQPLKRVVARMMDQERIPWLVRTRSDEDFGKEWRRLIEEALTSRRGMPSGVVILLHVPSVPSYPFDFTPWAMVECKQVFRLLEELEAAAAHSPRVSREDPVGDPQATRALPCDAPPSSCDESVNLAYERRAELLRNEKWLTSGDVHVHLGGRREAPGANNRASRLRKSGELLGVWDGRRYLYPLFQFYSNSEGGHLIGETKALIAALPRDQTGWRQAFWLFQHHAGLDGGARPADVFRKNPQAVIRAARSTFEPSGEHW